eukprot:gene3838-6998_t
MKEDDWKDLSSKNLSKDEKSAINMCYKTALMTSFVGAVPGFAFGYAFVKRFGYPKKNISRKIFLYFSLTSGALAFSAYQIPTCLKIFSEIDSDSKFADDARKKLSNFSNSGGSLSNVKVIEMNQEKRKYKKDDEEFDWNIEKKKEK